MTLSYRARRRLRRSVIITGIVIALGLTLFSGWVIWADRYIVYTRDGAKLDFGLSQAFPEGSPAKPPEAQKPVKVVIRDTDQDNSQPILEQTSIRGYYIQSKELQEDIPGIIEKLETLPAGTAVLMDMKGINGSFYYSTAVGRSISKGIDQEQISRLLEFLSSNNIYAIARVPAFRDWEYGLHNVPQGLPRKGGGGSLWMDEKNCYWLDPANEGVQGYLIRIATELKGLGFDEVVFSEFRFPDTDKIVYEGSKSEAISTAAATLVEACASDRFYVSFQNSNYGFPLPQGNSRLYLKDVSATDIPLVLEQAVTDQPDLQLLFLTEANDTRYNDYCVLRPLNDAIIPVQPTE